MTHVFIVDDNTFKFHLEYMFAGTGAGNTECPFLENSDVYIHPSTERLLVSMIADISRVRVGDDIIFYLQANSKHEGMFFGVFKTASSAFFDENDESNYLRNELGKGLSFRVLISPKEVYPIGVTEHEVLDSIELFHDAHRLCWSLIYRKLKGNRGCTMIMDYELKTNILALLTCKNKDTPLNCPGYTYDEASNKIISSVSKEYVGRKLDLNIVPRLYHKANQKQAFECHLQAFLVQKFAAESEKYLNLFGITSAHCFWIGNEVACGVGMQRIDILLIQEIDNYVRICPIELKDEAPNPFVFDQIDWYISWIMQFVFPNYKRFDNRVEIVPYIVAKDICSAEFINRLRDYQPKRTAATRCNFIGFQLANNNISFKQIT